MNAEHEISADSESNMMSIAILYYVNISLSVYDSQQYACVCSTNEIGVCFSFIDFYELT